jgi:hypothetical protein
MKARKKPGHIYTVFTHGEASSMRYFGSSEPAALRIFARSIVRYPQASSIELRRDSSTWARVSVSQAVRV